jgi:hypothetical protein
MKIKSEYEYWDGFAEKQTDFLDIVQHELEFRGFSFIREGDNLKSHNITFNEILIATIREGNDLRIRADYEMTTWCLILIILLLTTVWIGILIGLVWYLKYDDVRKNINSTFELTRSKLEI